MAHSSVLDLSVFKNVVSDSEKVMAFPFLFDHTILCLLLHLDNEHFTLVYTYIFTSFLLFYFFSTSSSGRTGSEFNGFAFEKCILPRH